MPDTLTLMSLDFIESVNLRNLSWKYFVQLYLLCASDYGVRVVLFHFIGICKNIKLVFK